MLPNNLINFLSRFSEYKEISNDWVVKCPCLYHGKGKGDLNPSLFVSLGEEGQLILKCWSGCSTIDILNSLGLTWSDLYCNDGLVDTTLIKSKIEIPKEVLEYRNNLYKKLIDALDLEDVHEEHLLNRGFTKQQIEFFEYKTIRNNHYRYLKDIFTEQEFNSIPGLKYLNTNLLLSGILIPLRDDLGNISALKIRRLTNLPKYIYLSDEISRSGSFLHFPKNFNKDSNVIRVTEGELKADICSIYTDISTVSLPGINNYKLLYKFLQNNLNINTIITSFDFKDLLEKPNVRNLFYTFIEPLKVKTYIESWDTTVAKGIDDALYNKLEIKCIDLENVNIKNILEPEIKTECVLIHEEKIMDKSVLDFPLDIFPEDVQKYINSVVKTTDSVLDFPSIAALIISGSAIGNARKIYIKKRWIESPIFYSAIIAPPGSSKSPAINAIQRPVVSRQEKAMKEYYKEISLADERKKKSIMPIEYYTTEATVAAITDRLINNPRGLLISTDEILSWVKSFNSFSSSNDSQFYLTIWNGQALKVDRKTGDRPVTFIKNPYVSVLGSIQPKKLHELYSEGRGDDGFLDRFLFSYPESREIPYWTLHKEDLSDEEYYKWDEIVNKLYNIPIDNSLLYMSDESFRYSINWYNEKIVDDLRNNNFPESLRGFWLKLKAYYFRFALVLELLDWASKPITDIPNIISIQSCKNAEKLCEYFKCHAEKVAFNSSPSTEIQQINELLRYMRSNKLKSITAVNIVKLNNPCMPKKITEVRNLLMTAQLYGEGIYELEYLGLKDVFTIKGI